MRVETSKAAVDFAINETQGEFQGFGLRAQNLNMVTGLN